MAAPVSICGAIQGAKQVCKCFPSGAQQLMVPTIIALLANIAEINVDCPTLQGLAQQYACIPPQLQMPAMLYLLTLVVNSTAGAGTIQVFSGIGPPTAQAATIATPAALNAIYFDNATPGQPNVWQWSNQAWSEFIGS